MQTAVDLDVVDLDAAHLELAEDVIHASVASDVICAAASEPVLELLEDWVLDVVVLDVADAQDVLDADVDPQHMEDQSDMD
jgi:hypothetical protein